MTMVKKMCRSSGDKGLKNYGNMFLLFSLFQNVIMWSCIHLEFCMQIDAS